MRSEKCHFSYGANLDDFPKYIHDRSILTVKVGPHELAASFQGEDYLPLVELSLIVGSITTGVSKTLVLVTLEEIANVYAQR